MASIIEGFTYDIFISYRQNDNKYDGWVTEFVDNLNKELEANIKDKISVYFDFNPHDGLLETHSVDQSLENKLKCLIFIPIISRTYCDSKSFAWQHEFVAFNKLAKEDQFGRDIRLASGNITSRLLPVKIHDLDPEDQKLLENELGGVLRGIEFIYKSSGVNRSLRANEDHPQDNINKTYYRDQINKMALAIKEIIVGLKGGSIEFVAEQEDVLTTEKKQVAPEKSIIVLPFENMSSDPEQEYFSDGLTEEIITDLSHIHDLLVISRSSSMTFKGSNKKIKEIANEVNVKYVLEGSVRKSGNNLRITGQLIDAESDTHIWAEKYNERMENIFEIQENVSRSIVNALKLRLTPEEEKSLVERPIDNVLAKDCYHKARYEILRFSEESLDKALISLQTALEIAGENPQLYAVMGFAHFQYVNIGIKQEEHAQIAVEYLDKALALDPDSAEASLILAGVSLLNGDIKSALTHIKKSLSSNPNDPDILFWGAWIYFQIGKNSVIIQLVDRYLKVDPMNVMCYMTLGAIRYLEGRYDFAVEHCLKAYNMQPDNPMVSCWYVLSLAYAGRYEDAISVVDECLKSPVQNVMTQLSHFIKLTLQGDLEGISRLLSDDFLKVAKGDLQMSYHIATFYSYLGQIESAFEWLENAVNRGFFNYPLMNNIDPFLKNIRGEERFMKLMKKVKYEWENLEV